MGRGGGGLNPRKFGGKGSLYLALHFEYTEGDKIAKCSKAVPPKEKGEF